MLWSDESKFNLFSNDSRGFVCRPINQQYNRKYTIPTVKFGVGNIMVWGCFSMSGVGPLYCIRNKMDQIQYREILDTIMLPYSKQSLPLDFIFQHDNDPKHTAKTIKQWLLNNNVTVLQWPDLNLNPIENLWSEVERKLRGQSFSNRNELFQAVHQNWNEMSPNLIVELINSMPRRCQAVINANGYATKY